MNLANSQSVQTPELVLLRHTPMQTENVGERRSDSVTTRIANKDGIWKPMLSDIEMAATHGDIETISEKLVYHKFIKDSNFETSKVFERKNIEERENINYIETRLEMTRSEHSSTSNCEKHGLKVNSEPDPSSSDSSYLSSSSDSAPKIIIIIIRKSVVNIINMTRKTHFRVMNLIHPRTVIIDVDDEKIRNTGKRILSDYAHL